MRMNFGDITAVTAAVVLMIMAIVAFQKDVALSYEVNTGIFCSLFCLMPFVFRHAKIMSLPSAFVVIIEAAIFLHAYGVLFFQYDELVYWDTLTHFISSVTVSLCVFYSLLVITGFDKKIKVPGKWMPLLIVLVAVTFGIYWEVFEYSVDMLTGTNMQYSPWDTIRDLSCDVLGSLTVSIYAYLYMKKHDGKDLIDGLELHPKVAGMVKRDL